MIHASLLVDDDDVHLETDLGTLYRDATKWQRRWHTRHVGTAFYKA